MEEDAGESGVKPNFTEAKELPRTPDPEEEKVEPKPEKWIEADKVELVENEPEEVEEDPTWNGQFNKVQLEAHN